MTLLKRSTGRRAETVKFTVNTSKLNFQSSWHRRSQGVEQRGRFPPNFWKKKTFFVLWEAFFQTKECYSPKIKYFVIPQIFWPLTNFWPGYATASW